MKSFPLLLVAACTLFVAAPALTQAPAPSKSAPATEKDKELEELRGKLDALQQEAKLQSARIDQLTRYLEAQAKAAQAMQDTLAQSEKEGFTYGINPRSREILLNGWREQLSTLQRDLPQPRPVSSPAQPKAR